MKKIYLLTMMLLLVTVWSKATVFTLKVVVPDTTKVCYVAGDFNGWKTDVDEMIKISDSPKTFSLDIDVADTSVAKTKYKYCAGPSWDYQQKQSADFLLSNLNADGDTVTEFVAYYDPNSADIDITIDVLVPATVFKCYLTGSFNGWNPTANEMELVDSTVNGKEFKITITVKDTNTLEFKFIAGPGWAYEQTQSANYKYTVDGAIISCDSFKDIFDPTKVGDITVNITVPEGTSMVFLIGSFNNWDTKTAIKATKNGDGTFTAVIPQQASVEYKCYSFNDWQYEEASDASGTNVPNRKAKFESSPVENITVAFWKKLYVPTAINSLKNSTYLVYSSNYQIIVSNVISRISVYDITGRLVESSKMSGSYTSPTLKSGIYIVNIDGISKKLIVK